MALQIDIVLNALRIRRILIFPVLFFCLISTVYAQGSSFSLLDAANLTLQDNPTLKMQEVAVEAKTAELRINQGFFDVSLQNKATYLFNIETLFPTDNLFIQFGIEALQTTYNGNRLSFSKTFNTGTVISPGFTMERTKFNVPDYSDYFNSPNLNLSIVQPLIKGRGRRSVAMNKLAAQLRLQSTTNYQRFAISRELMLCTIAYWNYTASNQQLEVFKENENRVKKMLEITKKLINAEMLPSSSIYQIEADLAVKSRQRIEQEQRLYQSKLELGRIIGLNLEDSKSISEPKDNFPSVELAGYNPESNLELLIDPSMERRYDLIALRNLTQVNQVIYAGAKRDRSPSLDLSIMGEYGGYAEGNELSDLIAPLGKRLGSNGSVVVGLTFVFPLQNNAAKGAYQLAELDVENQQIVQDNQERNARINISIAIRNLRAAVLTLQASELALENSQKAYDTEVQKFEKGMTVLLNLILFQERLTLAQLNYISASRNFAQTIIVLRHQTASLIDDEMLDKAASGEVFIKIPTQ